MADWIEVRVRQGFEPSDIYAWLSKRPASAHHFWDEPWWPGAYVVRLCGVKPKRIEDCPAVENIVPWDAGPDEDLYGDNWPEAANFFDAGSRLPPVGDGGLEKFVHCFLNSQGLTVAQEAKFAASFCWGRLTVRPRIWWRSRHA